jgi:hypothetical protein
MEFNTLVLKIVMPAGCVENFKNFLATFSGIFSDFSEMFVSLNF